MRAASLGLLCVAGVLAACGRLPGFREAPEVPASQAAWPRLLPIDGLLATVPPAPATDPAAAVAARAAGLRARAAALRAVTPSG